MNQFHLNTTECSIRYSGKTIQLLPKEYALFEFLYEHPNQVFSRERLLDAVWPLEHPTDRTVDDHIYRLRKKLSDWEDDLAIETVRGSGYRLQLHQEENLPLIEDTDFKESVKQLFDKYWLYGHGEALSFLANQHSPLGMEVDRERKLYFQFINGEFESIIRTEEYSFAEKSYYLLHILWLSQYEFNKTLHYFEQVINRRQITEYHRFEVDMLDLILLYIQTEQLDKAEDRYRHSEKEILGNQIDGFKIPLWLIEVDLNMALGRNEVLREKLNLIEEAFVQFPYQRERGTFYINKGLVLINEGNLVEGEDWIDQGIALLKKTKFVPIIIYRIQIVVFFLREYLHTPKLEQKYFKIWVDYCEKYRLSELATEIEGQLNRHL